jgi:hypothetical protein
MKPPHTSHQANQLFEYSLKKHLVLVVALVVILFAKNAPLFLAGQFVAEDSFYFYATAYNKPFLESITTPYAGYLHVMPMILAEALWTVPFKFLPWINHLVALSTCSALLSWLYSPLCRKLIQADRLRMICVLFLALTPLQPNLGMLLGLHWYLSYFLGIFLLSDLPKGRIAILISSCFVVLAAWSAPASIILIPIALYKWWSERTARSRYIPLCFAAASIAYALAIIFVFKPAGTQPGSAPLIDIIRGSWKMLHEGILFQCVLGVKLSAILPKILAISFKAISATCLIALLWISRKKRSYGYVITLLLIGFAMLVMTMTREFQSKSLLQSTGLTAERYLTTPTFYIWTALFIILSQYWSQIQKARTPIRLVLGSIAIGLLCLWIHGAPDLHGKTPLEQAFPHQEKVDLLEAYEQRYQSGGQPETLALPGWIPMHCMILEVGGGRYCETPSELTCIFGDDLKEIGIDHYKVDWFGEFQQLNEYWVDHEAWGEITIFSYEGGHYWFSDIYGQKYLSGPAIYPERFKYPPKGAIRIQKDH